MSHLKMVFRRGFLALFAGLTLACSWLSNLGSEGPATTAEAFETLSGQTWYCPDGGGPMGHMKNQWWHFEDKKVSFAFRQDWLSSTEWTLIWDRVEFDLDERENKEEGHRYWVVQIPDQASCNRLAGEEDGSFGTALARNFLLHNLKAPCSLGWTIHNLGFVEDMDAGINLRSQNFVSLGPSASSGNKTSLSSHCSADAPDDRWPGSEGVTAKPTSGTNSAERTPPPPGAAASGAPPARRSRSGGGAGGAPAAPRSPPTPR